MIKTNVDVSIHTHGEKIDVGSQESNGRSPYIAIGGYPCGSVTWYLTIDEMRDLHTQLGQFLCDLDHPGTNGETAEELKQLERR
jgi:hypothetical protein